MRFEIVDGRWIDARPCVGLFEQGRLDLGTGHGQPGLAAVGVDHRAGDDCQDGVAIGQRLGMILQEEDAAAFGTDVTVAGGVEDVASTAPREHRRLGKSQKAIRMQMQADAAGEGMRAFSGKNRATRLVKGDQRRRAGSVDRHARAAQVEGVGNPVGGNAGGIAGGGRRVYDGEVVSHSIGIVCAGNADVDATAATAQAGRWLAGIFDGFPTHLEQQALLRIHQCRFAWRYTEEARIERGNLPDRSSREGVARSRVVPAWMQEGVLLPALGIDLADQIATFEEVLPIASGSRARQPEGITGDGNSPGHGSMVPDFLLGKRSLTGSAASLPRRWATGASLPVLQDKRARPTRWRRRGGGERRWATAINDDCDPGFEQVNVASRPETLSSCEQGRATASSNNRLLVAWPVLREINDRKGPRVSCASGSIDSMP